VLKNIMEGWLLEEKTLSLENSTAGES